jgi:hypothetical protein
VRVIARLVAVRVHSRRAVCGRDLSCCCCVSGHMTPALCLCVCLQGRLWVRGEQASAGIACSGLCGAQRRRCTAPRVASASPHPSTEAAVEAAAPTTGKAVPMQSHPMKLVWKTPVMGATTSREVAAMAAMASERQLTVYLATTRVLRPARYVAAAADPLKAEVVQSSRAASATFILRRR